MKRITELLDRNAERNPEHIALSDPLGMITYRQLKQRAETAACGLMEYMGTRKPAAVFLDKGIDCVTAMLAVLYQGGFYSVIDPQMPAARIHSIIDTLQPDVIITDEKHREAAEQFGHAVALEQLLEHDLKEAALQSAADAATESDLAYVLFTSGSTGVPKGVAVTHRNVLAYSDWVVTTFRVNEHTVFGNQSPLYFSMSVTDLYGSLRAGAEAVLLPRTWFMFPKKLVTFMNERKVNTIYWVPSALNLFRTLDVLSSIQIDKLHTVLFAGEVMPPAVLNYWRKQVPDARFANLFGPTETTDICTWYQVDGRWNGTDPLPIGTACANCEAFLMDESGKECPDGMPGELLIRGPFVARGYYGAPEKTAKSFVQDPRSIEYPESVYRTGDIAVRGDDGLLRYLGRRDSQIKHMGYRIELGEIDAAASAIEGVHSEAALFDQDTDRILLACTGIVGRDEIMAALAAHLPAYMMPADIWMLSSLPLNADGKTDRRALLEEYRKRGKN
jgi:amino acid adenylation domain-containing protein